MNYKKIYSMLVERSKSENRIKLNKTNEKYVYYENHHIIPRAEGGPDTDENMVLLTAKEHYIAHLLLAKFTGSKSQIFAFNLMSNRTGNSHKYTSFREELSNAISEQTKKYIEENGHPKGFLGRKHSDETKRKISQYGIGRKQTDEQKQKSSERMKNNNPTKRTDVKNKLKNAWVERKKILTSDSTRKKQSDNMIGKIMINKDGCNKRIDPLCLNEYLDCGWALGVITTNFKKCKHDHVKNRIWVNKNGKSKMISKCEKDTLYSDWDLGRRSQSH